MTKQFIQFGTYDTSGLPLETLVLLPQHRSWTALISTLLRLGVGGWKRDYSDPQILDGMCWLLIVKSETLMIETSGVNVFPPDFSEMQDAIRHAVAVSNS